MYDKFGNRLYNDDRYYEQASRYDDYRDPVVNCGGKKSPFEINVRHPKKTYHDHYDSRHVFTSDVGIRCQSNYQFKVLSVIMGRNPKDGWFRCKEFTVVMPYYKSIVNLGDYHKNWGSSALLTFEEYIQKVGYTVMPLKKILI